MSRTPRFGLKQESHEYAVRIFTVVSEWRTERETKALIQPLGGQEPLH